MRASSSFLPPSSSETFFHSSSSSAPVGGKKGKEAGGSVIAIKSTRGKKDSGRGQRDGGEGRESHSKKCLFWRGLSFPSTLCAWLAAADDDDALSERVATG